ncbi:MAG: J domain-containing protein [Myxococcales bacterium]
MEAPRLLSERSLEELLWTTLAAREDGLVVLRDRDGLRHGVWVQSGFVVGIHVAGRFDPLLDVLRREGALTSHAYASCVQALWRPDMRSGSVAMEVAGVDRAVVRAALRRQMLERMAALLEIAARNGHDGSFEAGNVPEGEVSLRMPLGALLRAVQRQEGPAPAVRSPSADRSEARRQLRALAKELHPDRHAHLDPAARRSLERALAEATAAYHGLARGA